MSKPNQSQADSPESPVPSKPLSIRDRVLARLLTFFGNTVFPAPACWILSPGARVSKRDLYALFKNKHAVLAACIGERTQQMRLPLDPAVPMPQTRNALAALLVELGVSILKTVCHPEVLTVFRLAIAESDRAPEIARSLDNSGRGANLKALTELIEKAQALGLVVAGDPDILAARYFAALLADLQIRLLLRVRQAPTQREIDARARAATETLTDPCGRH